MRQQLTFNYHLSPTADITEEVAFDMKNTVLFLKRVQPERNSKCIHYEDGPSWTLEQFLIRLRQHSNSIIFYGSGARERACVHFCSERLTHCHPLSLLF